MRKLPIRVGVSLGLVLFFCCLVYYGLVKPPSEAPTLPVPQAEAVGVGRTKVSVTTSGAAGSATGSGSTDIMVQGPVMAVYVDYTAGMSPTTDITLAAKSTPTENILSLSNQMTDVWVYPRRAVQDNTGTDVTFDGVNEIYEPYWVADYLTLSVAQSSPTHTVTCYVFWSR